MSETKKIYGIDLGTTYSAIAFVDKYGTPRIIPNSNNEPVTASVVYYEDESTVVVGGSAKEAAKSDADRVVSFVKRQIPNKDWAFTVDGKSYSPEEISAHILRRIVGDANKNSKEQEYKHDVKDVIITCPAFFNDAERDRTKAAGELAGLNVVAIIDEPVAAAINYALNVKDSVGKNILVYDLGGGTFDVTVVSIGKDDITTICTDGNHQRGGKDWDDKIVEYYLAEFASQTGSTADLLDDSEMAYELQVNAEKDKQMLTDKGSIKRSIKHDGERASIELTREKFDELTVDLLEQTFVLTDKVIEEAKKTKEGKKGVEKIDAFLLVGGSTRMKQVAEGVIKRYGQKYGAPVAFDVDECVAKGAAQAGELRTLKGDVDDEIEKRTHGKDFNSLPSAEQEKITQEAVAEVAANRGYLPETVDNARRIKITTVATKSYGLQAYNASGELIIFNHIVKQTVVPARDSDTYSTMSANATELLLAVYVNNESERQTPLGGSNEELGKATFTLDGNLPAGAPIEVVFELDDQGKLILTAIDRTYGKTIVADFQSDYVMSHEEKEAAKQRQDLVKVSG